MTGKNGVNKMVARKNLIGIVVGVIIVVAAVGVGAWYLSRPSEEVDYWDGGNIVVDWCKAVPAEEDVALIFKDSVEAISDELEGLDLEVELVKTPWSRMVEEGSSKTESPNIQTTFVAAHYAEAGSLLHSKYHSESAATWEQNEWLENDTIDTMIDDAIATISRSERKTAYQEIQEVVMRLQPSLCLFDNYAKQAYQDYVDWPQGEGNEITGIMGFDLNIRIMEVTKGDRLKAYFSFPTEVDPAKGSDRSSSCTYTLVYDPLVFPTEGGGIRPWVAESWTTSSDGLTYNFTIRDGITSHTGGELTPEDVYYSMERMKELGRGYAYLFEKVNMTKSNYWNDENIVQFVLDASYGPFESTLCRLNIVDKDAVEAHDEGWLDSNDAGSGPYTVTEVVKKDHVTAEKVEDYWAYETFEDISDVNKPSTVIYAEHPEPSTVVTEMKNEEVEMTSQWLTESAIEELGQTEGISVAFLPTSDIFYYMMHTQKKPTDSIHLRKAIAYAMDYNKVVENVYPGREVSTSCVPTYMFGYKDLSSMLPDRAVNLDKAIEEIKKSKYWTGPEPGEEAASQSTLANWILGVLYCVNIQRKSIFALFN